MIRCSGCQAQLVHTSRGGEPLIRSAGLVLKADSIALVCPKCKSDVPVAGDLAHQLKLRLLVLKPA